MTQWIPTVRERGGEGYTTTNQIWQWWWQWKGWERGRGWFRTTNTTTTIKNLNISLNNQPFELVHSSLTVLDGDDNDDDEMMMMTTTMIITRWRQRWRPKTVMRLRMTKTMMTRWQRRQLRWQIWWQRRRRRPSTTATTMIKTTYELLFDVVVIVHWLPAPRRTHDRRTYVDCCIFNWGSSSSSSRRQILWQRQRRRPTTTATTMIKTTYDSLFDVVVIVHRLPAPRWTHDQRTYDDCCIFNWGSSSSSSSLVVST